MDDGSIRTQFDDLLAALKSAGRPMSVRELASASGMHEKDVAKWLHMLEQHGRVRLENRLSGVFAMFLGAPHPAKPQTDKSAVDVGAGKIFSPEGSFERELAAAREREEAARGRLLQLSPSRLAKERHKVEIAKADMQIQEAARRLGEINSMLAALNAQKKLREGRRVPGKGAEGKPADGGPTIISAEKEESQPGKEGGSAVGAREVAAMPAAKEESQPVKEGGSGKEDGHSEEAAVQPENVLAQGEGKPGQPMRKPTPQQPEPIILSLEGEGQPRKAGALSAAPAGIDEQGAEGGSVPSVRVQLAEEGESRTAKMAPEPQSQLRSAFEKLASKRGRGKKAGIKKPEPLQITGVATQFSERLSRQVQKIINQMHEIDKLRLEKEKLLNEHYLPMQRRLESEIETISDRVLRMERNILGMQERAANLPGKVSAAEKLQLQSIKAYGQMRRAYDEAAALLEEAGRELSAEREKMEGLVEQSRQEIASHRAKSLELEKALSHLSRLEEEVGNRVLEARAALAEQAERLASAERYAQELSSLKSEIVESVAGIKREIAAAKGALSGIEKQMEQMRQVELYAKSIREDYDAKMGELSDYITKGNEDFETLRESVEANFVRRYLKELRELTESYSFELGQAQRLEGSLDERINEEKKKLQELIDEGKRIAHLYELQSKKVAGSERFEQHGEKLAEIEEISRKRTEIENMIAQIVGKRGEYLPKVSSEPIKAPAYKQHAARRPAAKKAGRRVKGKGRKR